MASLNIQIVFGKASRIGPGKIRLLELVRDNGSISGAARSMNMSYRRAWLLVDDINAQFGGALLTTRVGGQGRGGATLTELGLSLIEHYRRFETECAALLRQQHSVLEPRAGQRRKT